MALKDYYLVGISGASGAIYGVRLVQELSKRNHVGLIVSSKAKLVLKHELDVIYKSKADLEAYIQDEYLENIEDISNNDMMSSCASGSNKFKAMVVAPCSMKTVAAINVGLADNIINRCADVALKEKRPLVLLPREMPFSSLHLRNLYELSQMGVSILPASPGFYTQPKTVDDLINFTVGKILDHLDIGHTLFEPWGADHRE